MNVRLVAGLACALVLSACGGGGGGAEREPSNLAPLAAPDTARTRPGVAIEIAVLANDSDPDGDSLSVLAPVSPASATVELLVDNRLRVTPAADFAGELTFNYQVRDGRGATSAPASVTVSVGPIGRALLGVSQGATLRLIIAGPRAGEVVTLSDSAPCGLGPLASLTSDMRSLIGTQCVSPTRQNLVVMAPRAPTLAPPVVLRENVALAPGLVLGPDAATVTVAERIGNPDDLGLPGTYELVRIDVASRSVLARLPLPGVTNVETLRAVSGNNLRILLTTGEGAIGFPGGVFASAGDVYVADFTDGSLVQINQAGGPPIGFGSPVLSPDGRFLLFATLFGDVSGYELANPGVPLTFWSYAARGESAIQVMPAPTADGRSLLVVTQDSNSNQAIWVLPGDDPASARELVRYRRTWTLARSPLIHGLDRLLLASDAAGQDQSEIREFRVTTGEVLATWTPPGGLRALKSVQRLGADRLLVEYVESAPPVADRWRVGILRGGDLTVVAPDLDVSNVLLGAADLDGTTFGLTTLVGGVLTPYVVDVNLPTQPFLFNANLAPGDSANVALVFLPPDS